MLEPLTHAFMQRALAGGILVGLLASFYGPFIVQRRLAFLGSGLGHAAFAGVALGILLGWPPLWTALPFTVLLAVAMVWVRARAMLAADTIIGIFFAVAMAAGVLLLSLKEGYTGDAFTWLFGSILYVRAGDLWIAGGVVLLTALCWPMWGRWAYATFDRGLARSDRLPVTRDEYALWACIALVVAVSIKVVGIVLIGALLVLPAATARLLARTFAGMTLLSVALGVSGVIIGLMLSYHANLHSGPAIILVQAAAFVGAMVFRRARA